MQSHPHPISLQITTQIYKEQPFMLIPNLDARAVWLTIVDNTITKRLDMSLGMTRQK